MHKNTRQRYLGIQQFAYIYVQSLRCEIPRISMPNIILH